MASSTGSRGGRRNSNSQLLEELEALSENLYHSQNSSATKRRTTSLVLPRTSSPSISSIKEEIPKDQNEEKTNPKLRSRRMSLSPWLSRTKPNDEHVEKTHDLKKFEDKVDTTSEKKGIWNWKPFRALSHIGMQKLSCLFSVEVVAVQGLSSSMNGLRLSVCVRKKESKDGGVQTMPSRVSQGAADFEETLFIRCNVYFTPGSGTHMKFEPRPFLIYALAVDAGELDFGKSSVDLSKLVQESIEKSFEGTRVRQWDTSFSLSGKAKGGELVLKLGFQIMEKDGGIGIYGQKLEKGTNNSPSFARRQSKTSFSVPSPKVFRAEASTPSQKEAGSGSGSTPDLQGMDELNLDEPAPKPSSSASEPENKVEDFEFPEFEVVDKGVEIQDKEIVKDQILSKRYLELNSIAEQIKALESIMKEEKSVKSDEETGSEKLDAEEETVTREFLQKLENSESSESDIDHQEQILPQMKLAEETESKVFLPDLGKGLGCVVQTRNGGYLAAMNPLNNLETKRDSPKLAMQISKPLILSSSESTNGFELFQMMAALGPEELASQMFSLMPMDELVGKTAEKIAFEGIASAIIQGRHIEGASSSAARTIATVKAMVNAMSTGRKERISTGIWNVSEDPLTLDEILAFSLQKIESMAIEALKIQTEIAEEEAPFDVSSLKRRNSGNLFASATPLEDWIKDKQNCASTVLISVVIQLRDPIRQFEAVGAPFIVLIHGTQAEMEIDQYDEEKRFKVTSLYVGGLKVKTGGQNSNWDSEKQRLTAMQWLVAYGVGKPGKKRKAKVSKTQDVLWSISSRIMADMWLKPIRNPDIKFTN